MEIQAFARFLYKAIKGKTKLCELDDEQPWVAETFLPTAAKDLENPEWVDDVVDLVATMIESYRAPARLHILAATSPGVLCKLFAFLMRTAISRLIVPQPSG